MARTTSELPEYAVILTTSGRKNLSDASKPASLRFFAALRMTSAFHQHMSCYSKKMARNLWKSQP
jgi:hypothetical protein